GTRCGEQECCFREPDRPLAHLRRSRRIHGRRLGGSAGARALRVRRERAGSTGARERARPPRYAGSRRQGRRPRGLRADHAGPRHARAADRAPARMKPRVTPLLPLVLMAFLGLLTLWLQYAVVEGFGGDSKSTGHDPDSIVENFTVQRLDASGKLRYTFSAPKMMHFADDGSGEALYPRFVEIAADSGNFIATANRGTINRQGEEAFLYGNVLILRDRKSTRLNSSHRTISYAVFCLKKKNNNT